MKRNQSKTGVVENASMIPFEKAGVENLAIIARHFNAEGKSPEVVKARAFICQDTDTPIVLNDLKEPFSPITAGSMKQGSSKTVELKAEDFNELVEIASVDLDEGAGTIRWYTTPELAREIDKHEFCDPTAGDKIAVALSEETLASLAVETESSEEVVAEAEEETDETTEEAADATNEEEVVAEDEVETAGDDEEDEEDEEEEDQQENDDEDDEDVYVGDDEEDEEEEASVAEEDNSDIDLETATLDINVTAQYDFDPDSVVLASIHDASTYGLFAMDKDSGQTVCLGTLIRQQATAANQPLFDKKDVLRRAIVTAMAKSSEITPLGFNEIAITLPIKQVIEDKIAEAVEAKSAEVASMSNDQIDDYKNSIEIAFAGINKGIFENPLTASLKEQLRMRNIQSPNRVAQRVILAVADDFANTVIAKADELFKESSEHRKATAKLIKDATVRLNDDEGEDNRVIASAFIDETTHEQETASVAPYTEKKNLFGGIGRLI